MVGGRATVRPMALHGGGYAPGRQGRPAQPAAGGEGTRKRLALGRLLGSWAFSSWPPGPSRWLLVHRPHRLRARAPSSGCPNFGPVDSGTSRPRRDQSHRSWAKAWTRRATGRPQPRCSIRWSAGRPWNRPWRLFWSGRRLDDTAAWLDSLPDHVRATYVTKDRPRPFQGPVLDRLLRGVGYPAADDLRQDVDTGFDMLGQVRSAPGWRRRSDEPEGLDRLRRENPTYVARKAATPRDQEHTRALLDELVAETRLGRVTGPCAAPDHWSVSTVALPSVADMVLRQPPSGDCFAALSFAICQVDENGELAPVGPQRHPATSDVPTHHFLGDIVDLVLRAWAEGWDPVVFGHDLLGGGRDALVPLRHVLRRRGERVEL